MIRLDTRTGVRARTTPVSCVTLKEASMAAQTAHLYLLEDLDDASKTRPLAQSDLAALRTVADWITTFVARPHTDLGREGPVCPFVPGALERRQRHVNLAWHSACGEVVQLINGYKTQFLHTPPIDGDGANDKVIVVVFPDLPADRARGLFGEVLQHLAVSVVCRRRSLFGPFYEGNEGSAIYNSRFRPFQSPVPFLFVRRGVLSDWKFFLDNEDWLNRWAHRMESPRCGLSLRNYAACRGGRRRPSGRRPIAARRVWRSPRCVPGVLSNR